MKKALILFIAITMASCSKDNASTPTNSTSDPGTAVLQYQGNTVNYSVKDVARQIISIVMLNGTYSITVVDADRNIQFVGYSASATDPTLISGVVTDKSRPTTGPTSQLVVQDERMRLSFTTNSTGRATGACNGSIIKVSLNNVRYVK